MAVKPKWALILALLTPLLLIVAVYTAGGGHGWYGPAILLFPWPLLGTLLPNSETLTSIMIILAFVQYPVYGFLIDFTKGTPWFKKTLLVLLSIHLFLMMMLLIFGVDQWH